MNALKGPGETDHPVWRVRLCTRHGTQRLPQSRPPGICQARADKMAGPVELGAWVQMTRLVCFPLPLREHGGCLLQKDPQNEGKEQDEEDGDEDGGEDEDEDEDNSGQEPDVEDLLENNWNIVRFLPQAASCQSYFLVIVSGEPPAAATSRAALWTRRLARSPLGGCALAAHRAGEGPPSSSVHAFSLSRLPQPVSLGARSSAPGFVCVQSGDCRNKPCVEGTRRSQNQLPTRWPSRLDH